MEKRRRMLAPMGRVSKSKGVVDGIIQDDWATIIDICCAGVADKFYSPGDKKLVTGTGGNNYFDYIGTDVDERSDGLDLPVVTWMSTNIVDNGIWGRPYNYGYWYEFSSLNTLCETFVDSILSYTIRQVLIPVRKTFKAWNGKTGELESASYSFKVWAPDKDEMESTYSARFPDTESRKKTKGSTNQYWLRSISQDGKAYRVGANGAIFNDGSVSASRGVVCGFCIGAKQ